MHSTQPKKGKEIQEPQKEKNAVIASQNIVAQKRRDERAIEEKDTVDAAQKIITPNRRDTETIGEKDTFVEAVVG